MVSQPHGYGAMYFKMLNFMLSFTIIYFYVYIPLWVSHLMWVLRIEPGPFRRVFLAAEQPLQPQYILECYIVKFKF